MEGNSFKQTDSNNSELSCLKEQMLKLTKAELHHCQILVTMTEQYKIKQKMKKYFSCQDFAQDTKQSLAEIYAFYQSISVSLTHFPCFSSLTQIFDIIFSQIDKIVTFSLQKWQAEVKALSILVKNKQKQSVPRADICLRCQESLRHQKIKDTKYHIFNLMIDDPFYYYQERVINPNQINGEQSSHKQMQEKLSELAIGVEMEQKYIKELLEQLNFQEKSVEESLNQTNSSNDSMFNLPVMPMLRSVFKFMKGSSKKEVQEIGIQTVNSNKRMVSEQAIITVQQQLKQLGAQKQKIQCKFATEIIDKNTQIKDLQEKIVEVGKVTTDLKHQKDMLMDQNITLQKKNSILEVQVNMNRNKEKITKLKTIQNTKSGRKQQNSRIQSIKNQIEDDYEDKDSREAGFSKVRGSVGIQGRMKNSQYNQVKSGLAPTNMNSTMHPRLMRKTDTPNNSRQQFDSTLSIERSEPRQDELNSITDLPYIRSNSNSQLGRDSDFYRAQTKNEGENGSVASSQHDRIINEIKTISHHRGGQKSKTSSPFFNLGSNRKPERQLSMLKQWSKQEKEKRNTNVKGIRRLGTIQQKQAILHLLYEEELRQKQKNVDFQQFKKGYEHFVIKVIGADKENKQIKDVYLTKDKLRIKQHLQKKSTASIRQYLRNQISEREETENYKNEKQSALDYSQSTNIKQKESKYLANMMSDLFVLEEERQIKKMKKEKIVLNMSEMQIMTQILAYMIQLKVNSSWAYNRVKKMIIIQQNKNDNTSANEPQTSDQKRQLKNSICLIIKMHRKCSKSQEDGSYCKHLRSFINNITSLMQN